MEECIYEKKMKYEWINSEHRIMFNLSKTKLCTSSIDIPLSLVSIFIFQHSTSIQKPCNESTAVIAWLNEMQGN